MRKPLLVLGLIKIMLLALKMTLGTKWVAVPYRSVGWGEVDVPGNRISLHLNTGLSWLAMCSALGSQVSLGLNH